MGTFSFVGMAYWLEMGVFTHSTGIRMTSIEYDGSLSWFGATLGCDGCVYWPPCTSSQILKYDPEKEYASLVGTDFGLGAFKWNGVSLAHDGVIYCIPRNVTEVLSIDPFRGFKSKLREDVEQYLNKLGLILNENEGMTAYESSVSNFRSFRRSTFISLYLDMGEDQGGMGEDQVEWWLCGHEAVRFPT